MIQGQKEKDQENKKDPARGLIRNGGRVCRGSRDNYISQGHAGTG